MELEKKMHEIGARLERLWESDEDGENRAEIRSLERELTQIKIELWKSM